MMMRRIFLPVLLVTLVMATPAFSQESGRVHRRSAVMNGNQVRTVFGNWGVIGQPVDTRPRGAWKNDNNGYLDSVGTGKCRGLGLWNQADTVDAGDQEEPV